MARSCGRCGLPGHNKRTCPALVTPAQGLVVPEEDTDDEDDEPALPSRPVGENLDAETIEAIEWYIEKLHPDWAPFKLKKR